MTARLIDGRALARDVEREAAETAAELQRPVTLAAVIVGNDDASRLYLKLKRQACDRLGFVFKLVELPAQTALPTLLTVINELNANDAVDGIIVQLPLPEALRTNTSEVIRTISPAKDADGFHPDNLQASSMKFAWPRPVLAEVLRRILLAVDFDPAGRRALLLTNGETLAVPMIADLTSRGCHVDCLRSTDERWPELSRSADLLVTAVGQSSLVTGAVIKSGSIVVDIGTVRTADGRITGDVDFASVSPVAGALTPVPGGVGPMTVATLILNVAKLAVRHSHFLDAIVL